MPKSNKFHFVQFLLYFVRFLVTLPFVYSELGNSGNILVILIDDLRHLPGINLNLPNTQKLAANSIYFKNTFAQQALCAPSRNSMLTGRRPDSLRLYDFDSYWRESIGNFTSLPQFFKESGWITYSAGKVFHYGKSSNFTDDFPLSWSERPYHAPTEKFKDSPVCKDDVTGRLQSNLLCPVNVGEQPGKSLPDLEILEHAIKILKKHTNSNNPFFLAVGFHKPHIPLKFPKEYLDKIPSSSIKLPKEPYIPSKMPTVSWHPWTDVRKRDDIHRLNLTFPFGIMPRQWSRRIIRNYYAASLYIDDLIGKLLEYVDLNKTVVVLTSDHGWSLGENGLWAKYSNFDVAVKVPLIISIPGMEKKEIHQPVELIDIFPTLVNHFKPSTNIPKCRDHNDKTLMCFEGKSLIPLMKDNSCYIEDEFVALSQYPRPSVYPHMNTDKPRLKDITIMGYSIRTQSFRYTEWITFNHTSFDISWDKVHGIELYDHEGDDIEANNLTTEPKYMYIQKYLSTLLRSKVNNVSLG